MSDLDGVLGGGTAVGAADIAGSTGTTHAATPADACRRIRVK